MRGRRSRKGEVAVFDIVLFMPLMLVALLFLQSAFAVRPSYSQEATNGSTYANAALGNLLISTVPTTKIVMIQSGQSVSTSAQNWAVSALILWDVYLVSCQTVYNHSALGQNQLDAPGWIGWSINRTAMTIGEGAGQGGTPSTFAKYYLEFSGTETSSSCGRTPIPVDVVMGDKPVSRTADVFTSDSILIPPALPGESQVSVVMGVWQQS